MIQFDVSSLVTIGADAATSVPATLTANASANVKGAYTELVASTSVTAHALLIQSGFASAGGDYLIDIALGGAGSEVVKWANLLFTMFTAGDQQSFLVPLSVPSGSRVAARAQSTTGSQLARLQMTLIASTGVDVAAIETCGATTADSGGTSVDPGAVANTLGAWSQLIASTSVAYDWLVIAIGNQANAARAAASCLLNIGTGGAGSEAILVPSLSVRVPSTGALRPTPSYFAVPVPRIAAGTRIAAQMQCSITDATDRLVDVVVYGIAGQEASGGGLLVHPGMAGGLRG